MAKVFVTGATGFIGKRLIQELLGRGEIVYGLCRIRGIRLDGLDHPNFYPIYGDLEEPDKMDLLPNDLDAAYYLVHSMSKKIDNLEKKEGVIAQHFVNLLDKTKCRQVIYLAGIIQPDASLSTHLRSRKLVEEILKRGKASLTVLRSSIIIGPGSASFEIIRELVEKLPVMIAPRWVKSFCQPIAILDVLFYLTRVLLNQTCYNQTFDIGGPEVISFKDVLLRYAKFRKLTRFILDVPFLTPRLSSYWLVFISSVSFSLCSYLVESMKTNSVCTNTNIQDLIPHNCMVFEEALKQSDFLNKPIF